MTLDPFDLARVQYLLGKQLAEQHLPPPEAKELRRLLAQENPHAEHVPWDRLVRFGLIFVGTHVLADALARVNAAR